MPLAERKVGTWRWDAEGADDDIEEDVLGSMWVFLWTGLVEGTWDEVFEWTMKTEEGWERGGVMGVEACWVVLLLVVDILLDTMNRRRRRYRS